MLHIEERAIEAGTFPFRSSRNPESSIHVDLDAPGYVEREFFVRGEADVRGPEGDLVDAAVPFCTRVMVRLPVDGFSGTVHLEPFHVLAEDTPSWTTGHRQILAARDAWVGVTVNAGAASPGGAMGGGLPILLESDPDRYSALELATIPPPAEVEATPGARVPFDPESMRLRLSAATPQGHHIIGQVARALRKPGSDLLGGAVAERTYATGWSQTGLFWRNYLDHGHHERTREDAGGTSPIDAYLINVAPPPDHHPDDAVLWHVLSEAEVVGTLNPPMTAIDHLDAPRRARGYEIPGAFHFWHLSKHTRNVEVGPDHPDEHNDRPWYHVTNVLLAHLDRWVREGEPPPRTPRIDRDPSADDGVARDEHGNATGGLRTVWVDVPEARYLPRCSCNPGVGAMRRFDDSTITSRYGSLDALHAARQARAAELVDEGLLLDRDAAEIASSGRGRG